MRPHEGAPAAGIGGPRHAMQALRAVVHREWTRFTQQKGRLVAALVRPVLWLAVFAAGLRGAFGGAAAPPYDRAVPYDVYVVPGLVGMVLLFNGMQSSLAMVYDREMGLMRLLLTAPLPRWWLLFARLFATALLSLAQAIAFIAIAAALGTTLPAAPLALAHALAAAFASALMLGALGLLLSVSVRQLENFAGTMNFVIFPMYFLSTALYPLAQLQAAGARWVGQAARWNPFTHAVEWIRFALYGQDPGASPWIVVGTLLACFGLACWGYDPRRGFGALARRGD
jgi:ABC-2 type transport system permease protein